MIFENRLRTPNSIPLTVESGNRMQEELDEKQKRIEELEHKVAELEEELQWEHEVVDLSHIRTISYLQGANEAYAHSIAMMMQSDGRDD